ncbi:unnamed protein product [Acanthoscelides obtectus]|uniref:Uncharacterized protein n=1 Tax=Acanthoscelides obtectus TaxID=200917 RepID=A0A9P0KJR1_ACAOB|nr:unnamed protein product [Acanthoscelides obtectus]CAK1627672.1 hypothetical protein AOBTE_LOCUS4757 [Acanthoscelides obtectus]
MQACTQPKKQGILKISLLSRKLKRDCVVKGYSHQKKHQKNSNGKRHWNSLPPHLEKYPVSLCKSHHQNTANYPAKIRKTLLNLITTPTLVLTVNVNNKLTGRVRTLRYSTVVTWNKGCLSYQKSRVFSSATKGQTRRSRTTQARTQLKQQGSI